MEMQGRPLSHGSHQPRSDINDAFLPSSLAEDLELQRAIRALPSVESVAGSRRDNPRYPHRRSKSVMDHGQSSSPDALLPQFGSRASASRRKPLDYLSNAGSKQRDSVSTVDGKLSPFGECAIEPTRIPKPFWKKEACPAPGDVRPSFPLTKDRMVSFDEEQHSFVTVSFPSAYPVSRKEVTELLHLFDQMFSNTEGPNGSHARICDASSQGDVDGILSVFVPQTKALDAVLHEAMRQVSTQCNQRGELLSQVRQHQERLFSEAALVVRSLGQQLAMERARNRANGVGSSEDIEGSQAMCDKLMGIVNSLMEERDMLSTRLAQLEQQLRDTEATLEKIMQEQRSSQGFANKDGTFFITGEDDSEQATAANMGKTENERILEERVQVLEAQLRTHEEVSNTHIKTYQAVERMREEKQEMKETVRVLTQQLQRLDMMRNPRSDQATQKPGLESVPPSRTHTPYATTGSQHADQDRAQIFNDIIESLDLSESGTLRIADLQPHVADPRFHDFVQWITRSISTFSTYNQEQGGTISVSELMPAIQKFEDERKRQKEVASEYPHDDDDSDGQDWS